MVSSEQSVAHEGNRLLTESEAASFLSMSDKWLQNQRWMGLEPSYVKIGRSIRYRVSDLESFLKRCEIHLDRS